MTPDFCYFDAGQSDEPVAKDVLLASRRDDESVNAKAENGVSSMEMGDPIRRGEEKRERLRAALV